MSNDSELFLEESARQAEIHAEALHWRDALTFPYSLLWIPHELRERSSDEHTLLRLAHEQLFNSRFPSPLPSETIFLRRDALGKPYALWNDEMQTWANENGLRSEHLHLSNTHDGDATLLLTLYSETVVGIGLDLVDLERLRRKDRAYFSRFAQKFMSEDELRLFLLASERENDEQVCVRVASHFSLMEAASKALGTGLKIGMGMGTPYSLPMQSIVIKQLAPSVRLGFVGKAMQRTKTLGVHSVKVFVSFDHRYLVSVVLFLSA
ncbi:MAG: 4'-phosphopantetheinyl transferase superfamily protein [Chthonomonadaceae bacterium]|nr:4'-phosphopantetheinyl transferase superfamily protein [Chthonomonadaceae bacterium]